MYITKITDCIHKELKCYKCMREGTVEYFAAQQHLYDEQENNFWKYSYQPFHIKFSEKAKAMISQILVNEIQEQELLNDGMDHGTVWKIYLWQKEIPKEEKASPGPKELLDETVEDWYLSKEDWEKIISEANETLIEFYS